MARNARGVAIRSPLGHILVATTSRAGDDAWRKAAIRFLLRAELDELLHKPAAMKHVLKERGFSLISVDVSERET